MVNDEIDEFDGILTGKVRQFELNLFLRFDDVLFENLGHDEFEDFDNLTEFLYVLHVLQFLKKIAIVAI